MCLEFAIGRWQLRHLLAFPAVMLSLTAAASDLSLGPKTVQQLVAERLFAQQGRWYLLDNGPCHAYFEHPKTRLTEGRLVLDAHLTARVGVPFGDRCAGSDFTANVTLSGKPVGRGSSLTLDEVRVDRVDDNGSGDATRIIRQMVPQTLPENFSFDVLAAARSQTGNAAGIPVAMRQFRIVSTVTRRDAVVITFEMSLAAP